MKLRWECDTQFTDCWDLYDGYRRVGGYIMRTKLEKSSGSVMGYCSRMKPAEYFQDLSVDAVKAVVEAMVRLEG